jgi:hypothetical protein
VILTGPTILVSPKTAHHVERVLHQAAEKARRDGYTLPDEVVDLLRDVRNLAAVYRSQTTADVSVSGSTDVPPTRRTLTAGVVGSHAGVSRHAVADAARRGRLPGHRVANRWEFDPTDVEVWIQSRRNGAVTR